MSFIYVPVGKGLETILDVDAPREILLTKWCVRFNPWGLAYVQGSIKLNGVARSVGLHRVILDYFGPLQVDHKNNNGLDNRRDNLRIATRSQNMANRQIDRRNKSGFKGVRLARGKYWEANLGVDRKLKYLGTFPTAEAAARAYDKAALDAFGEFAFLNFPEDAK